VAHLVHSAFPDTSVCVIGISNSLPIRQLQQARQVSKDIGIQLKEVPTSEGDVPEYVENIGKSCYYCKTSLYSTINHVIRDLYKPDVNISIYNGTNLDDLGDPTRIGIRVSFSEFI